MILNEVLKTSTVFEICVLVGCEAGVARVVSKQNSTLGERRIDASQVPNRIEYR